LAKKTDDPARDAGQTPASPAAPAPLAPGVSLDLAEFDAPVAPVPCVIAGREVLVRCLTAPVIEAIDKQIPVAEPEPEELNSVGEVSSGRREAVRQRVQLSYIRRMCLKVFAAASGDAGALAHGGERWTPDRSAEWCVEAADRLYAKVDSASLNSAARFITNLTPFSAPQADRIGNGERPGN
jgi:hypothetical protein